jgi:hypothetical protein
MPLEPSKDFGNVAGKIHSHRFPGANTALPTANEDAEQLKVTQDFLTSGALTVDIFALSPARGELKTGATAQHEVATTFAVGEEAEAKVTPGAGEAAVAVPPWTACGLRFGEAIRYASTWWSDQARRTLLSRRHGGCLRYLAGTEGRDERQGCFRSGEVEDNGKGPVERALYRSLQVDAHGNPINKRTPGRRAVVYVRLIPRRDTVHFA